MKDAGTRQPHARSALRVAVRVDASVAIGTGHLRRCLSLAQTLAEQGAEVVLVVRRLDGVADHVLESCGFPVHWLPAPASVDAPDADGPPHRDWAQVSWRRDADQTAAALSAQPLQWLVVDHYAFDARWHDEVRTALGCRLLVVDDVADRTLSPDALLDHNWAPDHRTKYRGRLTREPAAWLTGPRYALLSAAYRDAPRYRFHPRVRSIGVFMGGTDPDGASARVLRCLREDVGFDCPVEVASTSANPHLPALRAACAASPGTTLTLDQPDLAVFFARHDLQIGAGGGATWERCCIGVPTVGIALAENQAASLPALHRLGAVHAARFLASEAPADPNVGLPLAEALRSLLTDSDARRRLADAAAALVDGRGSERSALAMTRQSMRLRRATLADAAMLHAWRNHPNIRAVSLDKAPIDYADHVRWVERVVESTQRWLFIAQVGELPFGSIRFDRLNGTTLEVSLYLDPDLRAGGLGRRLLSCGEAEMRSRMDVGMTIHARVVPGNEASCRLFESCGYHWDDGAYRKVLTIPRPESESMK